MENYKATISTGHVTGYGIGPISNENTLIQFVVKISKKTISFIKRLLSQKVSYNTHRTNDLDKDSTPLFI